MARASLIGMTPSRRWPRVVAWAAVAVAGAMFVAFATAAPAIARGETFALSVAWAPALGVRLRLYLDELSLVFALLVTGIGALVLVYAIGYFRAGGRLGRFSALMLLFLVSMLGLVLVDDPVALYVCWELTSISSFFLIAFDDTTPRVRARARMALLVTSAGGLVLLVGLLLAAGAAAELGGTGSLSGLADLELREHRHYAPIVLLVALGAFTKSAHVPFHSWLPGAMVAPTPVSAYLHAATMVKAGTYLLARLQPALGDTPLWTVLLVSVGGATLVAGAALSVVQRDLKLTLAYATIAVLGALTLLLGIGTRAALAAFPVLLVAHALYKAALFLVAGNVDHAAGTRDPWQVQGLARGMPATAAAAALAAASMAGVFPLVGYVAKEMLYLAALTGPAAALVGAVTVAGGTLLVTAAWIAGVAPFYGARRRVGVHEGAATTRWPPLILAAAGAIVVVAPGIEVWSGLHGAHGVAFALGVASFAAGAGLYFAIARRPERLAGLAPWLGRASPARLLEAGAALAVEGFAVVIAALQSGVLRRYLAITIAVVLVAAGIPLALAAIAGPLTVRFGLFGNEVVLVAIAATGAVFAAVTRQRLVAVAALGVTGLTIAFLFALFSAPDLAVTQVMVETLMLIVLVAAFRRLPPSARRQRMPRRVGNAMLAAAAGALIALALLVATSVGGFSPDAADYFVDEAVRGDNANVVNAILVDFRAFDTLGEICVIAIAGLGVLALLRRRPWTR